MAEGKVQDGSAGFGTAGEGGQNVSVSAAIVLNCVRVTEEVLGKDVVARAKAIMPPNARAELDDLLAVSWCALETVNAFHRAVAEASGQDFATWHRKIVRLCMERTLTTLWRFLMRLTSVEAIVKRGSVMYSRSYDRGSLEARLVRPGVVEAILTGWPDIPDLEVNAILAGFEAIVNIARGEGVTVRRERLRNGTIRFEVRYPP